MGIDYRKHEKEQPKVMRPHPVWRGIGCVLMVAIPVFAFVLADLLIPVLRANLPGFYIPAELRGALQITEGWRIENFRAVAGLAFFFSVLLYGLLALVNAVISSMLGRNLENSKRKSKSVKPFIED